MEAYDLIKHIAQIRKQDWLSINAIQLAAIQPSRFREDLTKWMKDSNPEIRKQAFLALINHDMLSSQAYAACLVLDESEDVRNFVLLTIQNMRPQAKAAMLSRMSKSEHEIYKESVDCINKHLQVSDQSKNSSDNSLSAKHILHEDFNIVDHFERILETTKDNYQLASALLALGGISEDRAKIRKILMNYLGHEDDRVRANALEGFIELCSIEDARKLVQCSYSNRVVANAMIGLWKLGGQEQHIEAGITRLFNRGDIASFKSACHVLELIHDDAFAESLRIHLSRDDEGFTDSELYQEGLKLLHRLARHSVAYTNSLKKVQEFYLDDALSDKSEDTEGLNPPTKIESEDKKSDEIADIISILGGASNEQPKINQQEIQTRRLSPFCDNCVEYSKPSTKTKETAYIFNSFLSFGKRFHGNADKCSICNSVISTFWFCFIIPILPLGSYKLIYSRSMKEEILAMRQTSISLKQILANYILIAPLLLLTWFLADLKPEGISSLAHLEKANKLFVDNKYSDAIEFYEKAADLGQITAIYKLGIINYEGLGVPINQIAGIDSLMNALVKST